MNKINNLSKSLENKKYKVVEVTKTHFTLDNGDIYPHTFEMDEEISIEEFQKLLNNSKCLLITLMNKINNQLTDD